MNKDNNELLRLAMISQDINQIDLIISKGADVNAYYIGETPLHRAAGIGSKDIVDLLISKGADVNAKDRTGETPLHYAARIGFKEIADLLISKGADVNNYGDEKQTPLHRAVWEGFKEIADLLISKGADVNAKDFKGETPLHYAASKGFKEIADLLISKGADVNAKKNDGRTPLHLAVYNHKYLFISFLIEANAKLTVDFKGNNLLNICCSNVENILEEYSCDDAKETIKEILYFFPVDVNAENYLGFTPVHNLIHELTFAFANGYFEINDEKDIDIFFLNSFLNFLVKLGFDTTLKDKLGRRARDLDLKRIPVLQKIFDEFEK